MSLDDAQEMKSLKDELWREGGKERYVRKHRKVCEEAPEAWGGSSKLSKPVCLLDDASVYNQGRGWQRVFTLQD